MTNQEKRKAKRVRNMKIKNALMTVVCMLMLIMMGLGE